VLLLDGARAAERAGAERAEAPRDIRARLRSAAMRHAARCADKLKILFYYRLLLITPLLLRHLSFISLCCCWIFFIAIRHF